MIPSPPLLKFGAYRDYRLQLSLAATLFAVGCGGTTCFVGIINPPNNSLTVAAGTPPPVCALPQGTAMVNVTGNMPVACGNCAAAQQISHAYLSVSGIEVHPGAVADENSPEWREIAPDLGENPRIFDLVQVTEVQDQPPPFEVNGDIPAGTYYKLRLHLVQVSPAGTQMREFAAANRCTASGRASCIVNADGSSQAIDTLDGSAFLTVQTTVPWVVHAGKSNLQRIEFRSEWLPQKAANGSIVLAPLLRGQVVAQTYSDPVKP
jgi:Domain of unknown function (DUF4382)